MLLNFKEQPNMNTSGYEDHLMVTLIEVPWSDVSTEAGPYNNDTGGCQDSTDYKNVFIHGSVGIAVRIQPSNRHNNTLLVPFKLWQCII